MVSSVLLEGTFLCASALNTQWELMGFIHSQVVFENVFHLD